MNAITDSMLERLGQHGAVFCDHASGGPWHLSIAIAGCQVRGIGPTIREAWQHAREKARFNELQPIIEYMDESDRLTDETNG